MIISLNWLKKYTDIDMSVDELATLIGSRLVEIEEITYIGAKYKDVVVAHVVSADKLEGSDHLSVTKIDDGGRIDDIERDQNGYIQVVCGAPNIKAGQFVAWLPPRSIVPETYGDPEPFVLGSRKLCGVTSNGMIASAKELDLFDEHDGILDLDAKDLAPGASFSEAYELDDYLIDIENKSLTHRPDCFGLIGLAREIAAIDGKSFKTPDFMLDINPEIKTSDEVKFSVKIDNPELSSRYSAIVMSGSDGGKKSPLLIQTYLARVGVRPISAVVDITNYLMLLTGQPLHAFDFDKLIKASSGVNEIHVREGRVGEKLKLLDERVIELTPSDIVIAAGETAIGLAGAMGGFDTEIDKDTKNIIIESATFNLYNLRTTQMRHGIFSEAILRFTKGQPAQLSMPVLAESVRMMNDWTNAHAVSNVCEDYPKKQDSISIEIEVNKINAILGSDYSKHEIIKTLENVEFLVDELEGEKIKVTCPYWRSDIHIPEDIIEEIGRLNGFDNILPVLPQRSFDAIRPTDFDEFRSKLRKILVRIGSNEALSYSFVHGNVLERAGLDANNSYRIVNSISPDLQYYRQTITPSLLTMIHPNIKQGYDSFALFEINKIHQKQSGLNEESVPIEMDALGYVFADKNSQKDAAYYQSKQVVDYICRMLGVAVRYEPLGEVTDPIMKPFEPKRSARIVSVANNIILGVVGEYKKSTQKAFKLPETVSGFELDLRNVFELAQNASMNYKPLSRFPSLERDICFKVKDEISYVQIFNAVHEILAATNLETNIAPVDIYQAEGSNMKNITIRIRLTAHNRTLNGDEAQKIIEDVANLVKSKTEATVI